MQLANSLLIKAPRGILLAYKRFVLGMKSKSVSLRSSLMLWIYLHYKLLIFLLYYLSPICTFLFFSFPRLCSRAHFAHVYIIMYPLPPSFILSFRIMFYNILINQSFTKLFQKTIEKVIDIFGLHRYIVYFCTR